MFQCFITNQNLLLLTTISFSNWIHPIGRHTFLILVCARRHPRAFFGYRIFIHVLHSSPPLLQIKQVTLPFCLLRRKILSCCSFLFYALSHSLVGFIFWKLKLESVVTSWIYRKKTVSTFNVRSLERILKIYFNESEVRRKSCMKTAETVSTDFKWSFSFLFSAF